MKIRELCFVLLVAAVAFACSKEQAACKESPSLEKYRLIDENKIMMSADVAFERGDKRLLGINGVGLIVPSFSQNPRGYVYGIKIIKGVSDNPCNENQRILGNSAFKYSMIYNKEMLKRVSSTKR